MFVATQFVKTTYGDYQNKRHQDYEVQTEANYWDDFANHYHCCCL